MLIVFSVRLYFKTISGNYCFGCYPDDVATGSIMQASTLVKNEDVTLLALDEKVSLIISLKWVLHKFPYHDLHTPIWLIVTSAL